MSGLQAHRDHLPNEPHDVLLVVQAVRVAGDVAVLDAGDAVLVNHPFPEAVIEAVVVEQRAVDLGVGLSLAFDGVFGNQLPIELAGAGFEQCVKGGADGAFVLDAELLKLREIVVIGGYERVLRKFL